MDHDRLFKELLRVFFFEFVLLFLPDVAKYMERDSIEFLDKEIFTDIGSGERHEVDLAVKARFRGMGEGCFLIHVEPMSYSQTRYSRKMFHYFAGLDKKYDLPVYPVALFSFDRPKRREPDRYQVKFPGFAPLDFKFRVIQLNQLNWRDFLRNPNPVASALMTRMRIEPKDRPKVKLECLRMLAKLKLDKARATLIGAFMDNYLKLTAAEMRVYNRELKAIEPKEREVVMQLTNEWIEQGKAAGRQEGMQKGLEKGRQERGSELVLRLMRRRFGTVSETLARQIARLPTLR